MALNQSGRGGELRCGYQVAARLGAWTLNHDGRVEAAVADLDTFWLESSPQVSLWLRVGRRHWVWRTVEVVSPDPLVVKVIGSPTVRD
jgi:hypothetical protein